MFVNLLKRVRGKDGKLTWELVRSLADGAGSVEKLMREAAEISAGKDKDHPGPETMIMHTVGRGGNKPNRAQRRAWGKMSRKLATELPKLVRRVARSKVKLQPAAEVKQTGPKVSNEPTGYERRESGLLVPARSKGKGRGQAPG